MKDDLRKKFVDKYLLDSMSCCETCYEFAFKIRSIIDNTFSEGWDACAKETLKLCGDKIALKERPHD